MKSPLDDATVLITGASSGIGWAMAHEVAPHARKLVLVARRRDRLNALRDELANKHAQLLVHVLPADLNDRVSVDLMLEAVRSLAGPVDVLINNAGLGDVGLFDLSSWRKVEAMLRVNVESLCYLTHRLVRPMVERGHGGILNVSSGLGLTFMPGVAAYSATKHFVSAFTEALRLEVAHTGVCVTQLCPGPIPTEFDAVAGNPTGMDVPRFFRVTAERCARDAIRGFQRNKALVVPGLRVRLLILLGQIAPRFVLRIVYGRIGGFLRQKQQKQTAAPATS